MVGGDDDGKDDVEATGSEGVPRSDPAVGNDKEPLRETREGAWRA